MRKANEPSLRSRVRSAIVRPNSAVPLNTKNLTALNGRSTTASQIQPLIENRWEEFAKGQQTLEKDAARYLTKDIVKELLNKEID
jgi:UDP-galactopyranose mutase